jgi:hypothetical protein
MGAPADPSLAEQERQLTDALLDLPALIRPEPGPATCKSAPWAGERLVVLKGGSPGDARIAESWEFSTLAGSESRALGRALSDVIGRDLPFLAKLIDTAAPLSIQVHPEDDPAIGRVGKEEAWVILDAIEGADLLAGVRSGTSDDALRSAMTSAIEDPERGEGLLDVLERIPVDRGMVILVPAGTVHSIGPDILLAEIQQPVDCTYRLFDYGSDRPIQPDASSAAWRIDARPRIWRPGDPMRRIEGKHLALDIWSVGEATIEEDRVPRLLMAVGDGVHVSAGERMEEPIEHGQLRLHMHGPLHVRIDEGATLVTGTGDA